MADMNPEDIVSNRKIMIPTAVMSGIGIFVGVAFGFYAVTKFLFWLEGRVLFTI